MKLTLVLVVVAVIVACYIAEAKNTGQGGDKRSGQGKPDDKGKPEEADKKKEEAMRKKEKAKEKQAKARKEAKNKFKNSRGKPGQVDRDVGDSTLGIDKKGGQIAMVRKGIVFQVRIKNLIQRDENGTEVNKFNFRDVKFNVTKDGNDNSTYGVRAFSIELNGKLPNGAMVTLQMYMFREAANVTGDDGNIYNVYEGSVKFTLKIDYPETAKQLDVVLGASCGFAGDKGRANAANKSAKSRGNKGNKGANRRDVETFQFCANAQITFSPAYKADGKDTDMPKEPIAYPKSNGVVDGESEMVLRFENGKMFDYDPIMETGDDIGEIVDYSEDTDSAATTASTSSVLILSSLMMVVKMFF